MVSLNQQEIELKDFIKTSLASNPKDYDYLLLEADLMRSTANAADSSFFDLLK